MTELRAAGIEPAIGHAAANVPPGAEVVYSTAIGARQPGARGRRARARRHASCTAAELLGAARRAQALRGRRRHARQDDHDGDDRRTSCGGCGLDPAYVVGGELRDTGRNAAWGSGEWIVVEADESDRSLLKLRAGDRGSDQRRARPSRHVWLTARPRRDLYASSSTARAIAVVWDRPELLALAAGAEHGDPLRRGGSIALAGRRQSALARPRGRLEGPGAAQRGQRRRRADGGCAGRAPSRPRRSRAIAAFQRRAPAVRAARRDAQGPRSTTTTPTTRLRSRPRSPPRGRSRPRRLVAVFQPHLYSRTRALAREFGDALAAADVCWRARRLRGPRAGGGFPGRRRPPGRRGRRRRRRRPAGRVAAHARQTPSGGCARDAACRRPLPGDGRRRHRLARSRTCGLGRRRADLAVVVQRGCESA